MNIELPVADILTELRAALALAPAVILTSETGSGKTTWLPLQLMNEPWLGEKKILLLEPRRIAARAAAERLSFHLHERPGKTVGFSVRFERQVSAQTQIEVVTEGILSRRLAFDSELSNIGLVIFDEFHERHIETDLALALTLECQKIFRPDLKILIMSATMDTIAIQTFLTRVVSQTVPIIASAGRTFPIQIHHRAELIEGSNAAMARSCAQMAVRAHADHGGDILIFLPGTFEIFTAIDELEQRKLTNTEILPLYGELTSAEQDQVLNPSRTGRRRIIVATPIAESSITLENLSVVIDSGLVRRSAWDVGSGLPFLETVAVTQDAAQQRSGRAGRMGPGICYRMYSEADFRRRAKNRSSEILRIDLAQPALLSRAFGIPLSALSLLDMPSEHAIRLAEKLLLDLGCIDNSGTLTPLGQKVVKLPLHPRLSTMLTQMPHPAVALLAAQLSQRDSIRLSGATASDLEIRFNMLLKFIDSGRIPAEADRRSLYAIQSAFEQLCRMLKIDTDLSDPINLHKALLHGYPDRLCLKRETGSFLMRNGRGVSLEKSDWLSDSEFLIALDLDASGKNSKLRLGFACDRKIVFEYFQSQISIQQTVRTINGTAKAFEQFYLDALILSEKEVALPFDVAQAHLYNAIATHDLENLFDEETYQFCLRVEMLRAWGHELASCAWKTLTETATDWLSPFLDQVQNIGDLKPSLLKRALQARFAFSDLKKIETLLPQKMTVASGSEYNINYKENRASVEVRIQEVFGTTTHPMLAEGRLPITFQLLSPGRQPVALTSNLPSFWQSTYSEVRKELRGRYPRHFWPEDPLSMQGTTQTKKQVDRKKR